MAGQYRDTTTPGRGYTPAAPGSRDLSDERRTVEEHGAPPYNPPTGSESARVAEAPAEDVESDEAPSGRVQGG